MLIEDVWVAHMSESEFPNQHKTDLANFDHSSEFASIGFGQANECSVHRLSPRVRLRRCKWTATQLMCAPSGGSGFGEPCYSTRSPPLNRKPGVVGLAPD